MRSFFFNLLVFMAFCIPSVLPSVMWAQDSVVTVPVSVLSPTQKRQLAENQEMANLDKRIQTYGKWAGVGNEIGIAVNGTLNAINEQSAKFAETKVGKVAIALVIWKVIGDDIKGFIFAGLLVFIALPLHLYYWRRFNMPIDSIEYHPDGKKKQTIYQDVQKESDGHYAVNALYTVAFILIWVIIGFNVA